MYSPHTLNLYALLILGIWIAWMIYWRVAARGVKPAVRHESPWSRVVYVTPMVVAVLLFAVPVPLGILEHRIVNAPLAAYIIGVVLLILGLLFTVWARRHLGGNWSATVTLKQGHELVCSGPYRLVRHPIYTGLLLGFVGSALALDRWRGALAVLLVFTSLWLKLRHEERWLTELFGDAYRQYRRRVSALIPYLL